MHIINVLSVLVLTVLVVVTNSVSVNVGNIVKAEYDVIIVTVLIIMLVILDAVAAILTVIILYIILAYRYSVPLIVTDGPYPITLTGMIVTV